MAPAHLAGRLLVARPTLVDPNFRRTVVLILAHGDDGALGVVLNRPSGTEVREALPEWGAFAAEPSVVFVGGPVGAGGALAVARVGHDAPPDAWSPVVGRLGTLDLARDPTDIGAAVEEIRVFVGYAGWGPGQLEGEIDAGGWVVVDADAEDALHAQPDQLWRSVLKRQGGTLAVLANYPPDLRWN